MSDKTITPGPWLAPCGYGVSRFEVQGDGQRVAVVDRVEDARAISAVPDMLAALFSALPFVEEASDDEIYKSHRVHAVLKEIRAAIAKATGSAT